MKNSDEKLNQLLKGVSPASPRIELAQQIIAQADPKYHIKNQQNIKSSEESIFKQIIRGLIFPKPAYALACSMLVGVLLGWQSPELTGLSIDNNVNVASAISVEEDLSSLFLAEVSYYE